MNTGIGKVSKKKLLENPIANGIVVPIAIVLVGAFVVFGVTRLLSTERSYRDLVREMNTKTFGNRWVAAFELSKLISREQIPPEEIPWLINNLKEIYDEGQDPRTRQFTVVAAGALRTKESLSLLEKAVEDPDEKVRFHAVVALGNMPRAEDFKKWDVILSYLERGEDIGLTQAAALSLATHKISGAVPLLKKYLTSQSRVLRYTVASALVNYKNEEALPLLKEILSLPPVLSSPSASPSSSQEKISLSEDQIVALKLSLLNLIEKNHWKALEEDLERVVAGEKNLKVVARAQEVLKALKN